MKICYVVRNLNPQAGWGRLSRRVGEEVAKHGHEVCFVAEDVEEPADNVLVTKLSKIRLSSIGETLRSIKNMRAFFTSCDVILCYDVKPFGLLTTLAAWGLGKKVIIFALATYSLFEEGNSLKTKIRNWLIALVYKRADTVFVVSEFTKRKIEQYGFRIKNPVIIPVGVSMQSFYPRDDVSPLDAPYIISVGAAKHRKGYHLSIEAFGLIAKEFPDLRYVIRGGIEKETEFGKMLLKKMDDMNITDRIDFMGPVSEDELAVLYSNAEAFLLTPVSTPDFIEGFGMVYLEAGGCGIPVVGTYDSGAEAAIVNGYNGLLAQPNAEDIAQALRIVLTQKDSAKEMGQHGIERSKLFQWDVVAKQHLEHY